MMIGRSCDTCENKWICMIKDKFNTVWMDARICIEHGMWPETVGEFYKLLAKNCLRYEYDDSDD